MIVNSCYFLVVVFVCFPSLGFTSGKLSVVCVFVGVKTSLGWSFPSSTFCRAEFVDKYCLNLVLSWSILFSLSMVIESIAGYSSLGWYPRSFSVCSISVQDLLASLNSLVDSMDLYGEHKCSSGTEELWLTVQVVRCLCPF